MHSNEARQLMKDRVGAKMDEIYRTIKAEAKEGGVLIKIPGKLERGIVLILESEGYTVYDERLQDGKQITTVRWA